MVIPICPQCREKIPGDDINVARDVAFCRRCNLASALSGLVHGTFIDPNIDLSRPPKGAWQVTSGLGTVIGASHRSIGGAVGMLLIAAFWNGIVSIFVALALSSTLALMSVQTPAWFPGPVMNGRTMGAGVTVFLWVFLLPFIAIGLALIAGFLSCLAGKTEVRIRYSHGELFNGIGRFGFRKRFTPDAVKDVRLEETWQTHKGRQHHKSEVVLEMIEGKPLKLGSSLPEDRRQFLAAALKKALVK